MTEKITNEIERKTHSGYQFLIISIITIALSAALYILAGVYSSMCRKGSHTNCQRWHFISLKKVQDCIL
jgi:hypothetical protein